MKQKGKIWIDATGREVPVTHINYSAKEEERQAQKLLKLALSAEAALKKFKDAAAEAYNKILEIKMKEAEMTKKKVSTGAMTFGAFDGTIEVKITKPDILYFDNTMTDLVKAKFGEYFDSFGSDNDQIVFLRDLVNDLLYTSGGNLDNGKVLKLRKYRDKFKNNKRMSESARLFVEAVDLFDKAIKTKPGNTGMYVSFADNPHDKKRKVGLKYTDV